jgi:hypothetical protein
VREQQALRGRVPRRGLEPTQRLHDVGGVVTLDQRESGSDRLQVERQPGV